VQCRLMTRSFAGVFLSCFVLLSGVPSSAAEKQLMRMGKYRISIMEGQCAKEVDLILHAPSWEAFKDKDAEIQQASKYAEYDVRMAGCSEFESFRVQGRVGDTRVYAGRTSRSTNWVPQGGIVEGTSQEPTPPPTFGIYGPGNIPARDILESYAAVDSASPDKARCGSFVLRDPFGSGQRTTAEAVVTRLAGGDLGALISSGGRYGDVLRNISSQRNDFNKRCQAAILLERESICTPDDFDCAVVLSCTQYTLPHASDESRALLPSCIDTATRRIAEKRQRVLAAQIALEEMTTELIIAKFPGADEQLGEWCGETLYAIVNWPQDYNLTPSLARTISDILNESLSYQCPKAENLTLRVDRFTTYGARRNFSAGSEQFLRAYRESGVWNIAYHEDFLQQQRGQAYISSLFKTMKAMGNNPTSLGFAVAAGPLNAAMAAQQSSRFAKYAREGKVCQMRDAVRHCHVSTDWVTGYGGRIGRTMIMTSTPTRRSSCAEPCKFHEGYCNMETGARYPDAESAERANCRDASQNEIEAAIAAANVSDEFPPYEHKILYLPWERITGQ